MKNEVKKKMMMREHRSAVRKSPKREFDSEINVDAHNFSIAEMRSSLSSAQIQASYKSHVRIHCALRHGSQPR